MKNQGCIKEKRVPKVHLGQTEERTPGAKAHKRIGCTKSWSTPRPKARLRTPAEPKRKDQRSGGQNRVDSNKLKKMTDRGAGGTK